MTKQAKSNRAASTRTDAGNQNTTAHQLAQALFKLRLDLKALASVTGDDEVIARPCGLPIHLTPFHDDALVKVCEAGRSALRTSFRQVLECFRILHTSGGPPEYTSALRVIGTHLNKAAQHLRSRPFTNDRRMMTCSLCTEACDLCGLAIRNLTINNARPMGS